MPQHLRHPNKTLDTRYDCSAAIRHGQFTSQLAALAFKASAENQTRQCASFGLLSVAIASLSGIVRFGFSDTSDTDSINGNLADLVAFVGLPMVGRSFLETFSKDRAKQFDSNLVPIILSLLTVEAISRP